MHLQNCGRNIGVCFNQLQYSLISEHKLIQQAKAKFLWHTPKRFLEIWETYITWNPFLINNAVLWEFYLESSAGDSLIECCCYLHPSFLIRVKDSGLWANNLQKIIILYKYQILNTMKKRCLLIEAVIEKSWIANSFIKVVYVRKGLPLTDKCLDYPTNFHASGM